MSEYPKEMAKGDLRRQARHLRDEVKFKFDGYKPVETTGDNEYQAPPRVAAPEADEAPAEVQSESTAPKTKK